MPRERWRPVVGFEGLYEVSNLGRIRSLDRKVIYRNGMSRFWRGQILKPTPAASGYPSVQLCRCGTGKTASVHSLVAAAFIGPRPQNKQVAHRDGDKSNPKLSNLRYATSKQNQADKISHGRVAWGERNGLAKLADADIVEIRKRLNAGERGRAVAKAFGVTPANISQIKLLRTWTHL